jgi:hypothetical protein
MSWLHELHALQDPEGCFPSTVTLPGGPMDDCNGFVTALVVRALRNIPRDRWSELRERALGFLWSCRSSQVPGAFAFWSDATRPPWASSVPADADDTAIMLGELLRHGWLDQEAVLRCVCGALLPYRVSAAEAEALPPWIGAGSFFTWLAPPDAHPAKRAVNLVDCCVNANVAALLSQLNARHLPGYAAAVHAVLAGLQWAGDNRLKLSSLTPFYPSSFSLVDAIDHAVECGVRELRDALAHIKSLPSELLDGGAGVCRSAYGSTIWYSTALEKVRHPTEAHAEVAR